MLVDLDLGAESAGPRDEPTGARSGAGVLMALSRRSSVPRQVT